MLVDAVDRVRLVGPPTPSLAFKSGMQTMAAWQCSCWRNFAVCIPYLFNALSRYLTPDQKDTLKWWTLLVVKIHARKTTAHSHEWVDYIGTQFRLSLTLAFRKGGEVRGNVPWPAAAPVQVELAVLTREEIMALRVSDLKEHLLTVGIGRISTFHKPELRRALLRHCGIEFTAAESRAEAEFEAAAAERERHVDVVPIITNTSQHNTR